MQGQNALSIEPKIFKFWWVVFEKSQKVQKAVKNSKDIIIGRQKNWAYSLTQGSFSFYLLHPKSQILEGSFWKNVKKIWVKNLPILFRSL